MGVLNITPDSFSDGGAHLGLSQACARAEAMLKEGVDIFDIGGESTRPGASSVSVQEELDRIVPVIEAIKPFGKPISIDTRHTAVMRVVLDLGVDMINDVNALQDDGAVELLAGSHANICLMHMQGQPKTMQENPQYGNVLDDVIAFLKARIKRCEEAGIAQSRLVVDPGFGFGKTLAHNLALLNQLKALQCLDVKVLVGLSRKSMFGLITEKDVGGRMPSSLTAAVISLLQGVDIIRTHDVAPLRDAIKVLSALREEAFA